MISLTSIYRCTQIPLLAALLGAGALDLQAQEGFSYHLKSKRGLHTEKMQEVSMSSERMREILGSVTMSDLVNITPGSIEGTNDTGALSFAICGSTQTGTKVVSDGVGFNLLGGSLFGIRPPIKDNIESIAVIQAPMNARYGNKDGGMVSIVTARGINQFIGSIRVSRSKRRWRYNHILHPNNTGEVNPLVPSNDDMTKNYKFTLRGSLRKNHLTFSWAGRLQSKTYSATRFCPNSAAGNISCDR